MQFWIIRNGESVGPLTMEQLKALNIDRQTKIWYETLTEWTPAANTPYADEIFEQEEIPTTESCDENSPTSIAPDHSIVEEQTPPTYNPQNRIMPEYGSEIPPRRPQPPHFQPYRNIESNGDPYTEGYRKGLEDAKKFNEDTDISKCPPTNLVWAILSTVLCCQPFGIVAIIYASKVKSLYNQREYLKAKKASDKALYWSLGSAIVWMVTYPIVSALSLALTDIL